MGALALAAQSQHYHNYIEGVSSLCCRVEFFIDVAFVNCFRKCEIVINLEEYVISFFLTANFQGWI